MATGERQPAPRVRRLGKAVLDEDAACGGVLNHAHITEGGVHYDPHLLKGLDSGKE